VAWHFLTSASLMLAATVAFILQGRLEAIATGAGGGFLFYVGILVCRRFAGAIRGDDRFRF
jgi:hypothetical protein